MERLPPPSDCEVISDMKKSYISANIYPVAELHSRSKINKRAGKRKRVGSSSNPDGTATVHEELQTPNSRREQAFLGALLLVVVRC
jgi:hypothetical protein